MSRREALIITFIAALVAIAVPTSLALYFAQRESLRLETDRAMAYARDVLHRSESTADQIDAATRELAAAGGSTPCSDANVALMRRFDLASSYIQAVGYVSDNRFLCSSLGSEVIGLDLGPVDLIQPSGVKLRTRVEFPFAKGTTFLVVERDGYAAIINKRLPIDTTTDASDITLATLSGASIQKVLAGRGYMKAEWLETIRGHHALAFVDDNHVVAAVTSSRYAIGALAALPTTHLTRHVRAIAALLVPVGVLAGMILALVVVKVTRTQFAMPAMLKSALAHDEFFLVYQPVVDLRTGRWVGAEALIRWRRPGGDMVSPDHFIPVAERAGLIGRITARVIDLVAREASDLFVSHPDFHIAINLAASDLTSRTIIDLLLGLARKVSGTPRNLIVEVTERSLIDTEAVRELIRELRAAGIHVAIDDFGTGYSSLSYVETFAFDFLKIDKSFVDKIGTKAVTSHVVSHIIEMAKDLKLEMVAEGIETQVQAHYLQAHGVAYGQGWLFAEAMPLEQLRDQLNGMAMREGGANIPG